MFRLKGEAEELKSRLTSAKKEITSTKKEIAIMGPLETNTMAARAAEVGKAAEMAEDKSMAMRARELEVLGHGDPLEYEEARGRFEALGVDFPRVGESKCGGFRLRTQNPRELHMGRRP